MTLSLSLAFVILSMVSHDASELVPKCLSKQGDAPKSKRLLDRHFSQQVSKCVQVAIEEGIEPTSFRFEITDIQEDSCYIRVWSMLGVEENTSMTASAQGLTIRLTRGEVLTLGSSHKKLTDQERASRAIVIDAIAKAIGLCDKWWYPGGGACVSATFKGLKTIVTLEKRPKAPSSRVIVAVDSKGKVIAVERY